MTLSASFPKQEGNHLHRLLLIFAAAAALTFAPVPAFAQHGGGGGGHAGGGGFGGGSHAGGFSGGGHASGGGFHGGGGSYHAEGGDRSGSDEIRSAHGGSGSTGGGHWWSGVFGRHTNGNSENTAAGSRGESAASDAGSSRADAAARMAFANAVSRDNLAIHNTWQDPPAEFSGARGGPSFTKGLFAADATPPRGNRLTNARPFTPPSGFADPRAATPRSASTSSPRSPLAASRLHSAAAAPISPRGFYRRRYIGYPYYYSPYFYGGLGFGFYGGYGYGFGCDPFWGGWDGSCLGSWSPFWGGYGGYGYPGDSYYDDSSAPNYQVFGGGADSGPDGSNLTGNPANENYTYQNSPQDTGVAADQSGANDDQPFVLYLKDGSSYAVTRYWVAGGNLHYMTTYGGENSVALDQVDVQKTVDENAALGHSFTLAPAPGAPDAAPAPNH